MNLGYHIIGTREFTVPFPQASPSGVGKVSTKNFSGTKIKKSELGMSKLSNFRYFTNSRIHEDEISNVKLLKSRFLKSQSNYFVLNLGVVSAGVALGPPRFKTKKS